MPDEYSSDVLQVMKRTAGDLSKFMGQPGFTGTAEQRTELEAMCSALHQHMQRLRQYSGPLEDGSYWVEWEQARLILLCALPSSTSALRCLPSELLGKVARYAYRPRHRPTWQHCPEDSGSLPSSTRYTQTEDDVLTARRMPRLALPAAGSGAQYYVVSVNNIEFGSQVDICGLELEFDSRDDSPSGLGNLVVLDEEHISLWDEVWEYQGVVTFDILLGERGSPSAGERTLTIALNGVVGPSKAVAWPPDVDGPFLVEPGHRFAPVEDALWVEVSTPAHVPPRLLGTYNSSRGVCVRDGCEYCSED